MSNPWQMRKLLAAFARDCGLDRLELSRDGRATLTIGEVPITLRYVEEPAELLILSAAITAIPEDDTAISSYLLELTFTTWLKGLITIGLAEDGRRALGYQAIPVGLLDAGTLASVLGQMVETTLAIRSELERGAHLQSATAAGRGNGPGPSGPWFYA